MEEKLHDRFVKWFPDKDKGVAKGKEGLGIQEPGSGLVRTDKNLLETPYFLEIHLWVSPHATKAADPICEGLYWNGVGTPWSLT